MGDTEKKNDSVKQRELFQEDELRHALDVLSDHDDAESIINQFENADTPEWVRTVLVAEVRRCQEHLLRVGQPYSGEAVQLWIGRRINQRCPISQACEKPRPARIFCERHGMFENTSGS